MLDARTENNDVVERNERSGDQNSTSRQTVALGRRRTYDNHNLPTTPDRIVENRIDCRPMMNDE